MSTPQIEPIKIPSPKMTPRNASGVGTEPTDTPAATGVRAISKRLDMIRFLAERLNSYEPRIAVEEDMVQCLMDFFKDSKKAVMFESPPFEGGSLLNVISWEKQGDPQALRCGLPFLKFLCQLNDSVALAGGVTLFPSGRLIRIMAQYVDDGTSAFFAYRYRNERVRIRTTAAGEAHFGVCMDVRLGSVEGVPDEDFYELIKLH